MLRILHVGLGPLGVKIVTDLHTRGVGKVVAAVDTAPELVGKKLSEVVSGAPDKPRVQKDFQGLDFKKIDAVVVATSSDLAKCAPTFEALLKQGASIVSSCEELSWPYLRHAALSKKLDKLAKANGGRLLGTGVNPGFLMDAFPVAATAICRSVQSVEVHRFQDASSRRVPFQKKIGVGLDDAGFEAGIKAGWLRHVGLGESLHFIAARMGWTLERWEEDRPRAVKATKAMSSGLGPVKKGLACGVYQEARGYCAGKEVVTLKFEAALGLKNPHDRVVVVGEPSIDLTWKGGVQGDIATSAIVVNSIASLLQASPGLHTMASIPLVSCTPGSVKKT
jgi:hypothetical protein